MIGVLRRAVGNGVVLAALPGQHRVPRATRTAIEARRDARIRDTVAFAARHVPHYRDLFADARIDPRDIRGAADLDRLPLVDKSAVRRDPDRFAARTPAGRAALVFLTSGSTGERVSIRHDRASLLRNIAYSEREREVITSFLDRPLGYREATLNYPGSTLDKVTDLYRQATWIPARPTRLQISVLDTIEANAAKLAAFEPAVVFAYGSYLEALHRAARAGRIRLRAPRVFVYGAEGILPAVREEIERTHGAPVVGTYAAVEAFKIGFHCERRDGFHLHEDLCHVRLVDGRGEPVAAGQEGEVVISNLVNRGTVLLNYRLGDRSQFLTAPCGCGRTLRRLGEVDGRSEDVITLPDGRLIHPRAVWGLVKFQLAVRQYQLVQTTAARFNLALVTDTQAGFDAAAGALAAGLADLLGPGIHISVERRDAVPLTPGGKVRLVVAWDGGGPA
jgi:phenylacetate-CoA ligase